MLLLEIQYSEVTNVSKNLAENEIYDKFAALAYSSSVNF